MSHRIALNFEDGVTRFVTAHAGESIADAAFRQGVNVPLDCRDGACGTCKARRQSGAYDPGDYIEDALSDDEAAQGYLLCCQATAQSDMVVDIPASSAACKAAPVETAAVVTAVERLSPNRIRLAVQARDGALPAFLPGQYVNVRAPGTRAVRSYSFASASGAETASFLIRYVPGGAMSSWLTQAAKPGDALALRGPLDGFYLREVRRPVLLIAGGAGVAPILSMLETLARDGARGQPVRLLYGVRHEADLVGAERIAALAEQIPDFGWTTCCSAPDTAHPRTGYVGDHLDPAALNGGEADVYLCGPPAMVEAVRKQVMALGLPPERLHFEKFTPATEALAA